MIATPECNDGGTEGECRPAIPAGLIVTRRAENAFAVL